jgi:methylated-DNA-[protein]-cysteine S-methyltransferase
VSAVYTVVETDVGPVRLAATDEGLCKIALGMETPESFASWLARHVGPATQEAESRLLTRAATQLNAYLDDDLREFDLPLDLRGTSFQRSVWRAVADVRYGQTVTYSEIAARIGRPNAIRAVGAANGANPLPILIPCHRVIGRDGTLRGYGGGLHIKEALLSLEGAK